MSDAKAGDLESPAIQIRKTDGSNDAGLAILSWSIVLGVCLVPMRAQGMGYGWHWLWAPLKHGPFVLAGAYHDLCYVAGLGLVFYGIVRIVRFARFQRAAATVHAGVAIFSLLLGLTNIQTVWMLGRPLNYAWLYYSDFLTSLDARQAIAASLTTGAIVACLCGLAGAVIASRLIRWSLRRWVMGRPAARRAALLAVLVGCAYVPWAIHTMRGWRSDKLQNPVVALVGSAVWEGKPRLLAVPSSTQPCDYEVVGDLVKSPVSSFSQANPPIRNVLIFVLESTAAQYLPAYGGEYPIMPRLGGRLAGARIYDRFYAHTPATNSSMLSLLCSIYDSPWYRSFAKDFPDADLISISDVLAGRGYRTGFFYSADLRFGHSDQFVAAHKFDVISDHRSIPNIRAKGGSGPEAWDFMESSDELSTTNAMLQWLSTDPAKPFLGILWTGQTHYPYFTVKSQAPWGGDNEFMKRYLNALSEVDEAIGHVLDTLETSGRLDDTLIIVVGDHGEAFGQHNQSVHANHLYQENVHIPLMLINRRLFGGDRDPTIGGMIDLAPTITDILGVPAAPGWQGRSLFASGRSQCVYLSAPLGREVGFIEGNWKYIYDLLGDRYDAYDLGQDPNETVNRAAESVALDSLVVRQRLATWIRYTDRHLKTVSSRQKQ